MVAPAHRNPRLGPAWPRISRWGMMSPSPEGPRPQPIRETWDVWREFTRGPVCGCGQGEKWLTLSLGLLLLESVLVSSVSVGQLTACGLCGQSAALGGTARPLALLRTAWWWRWSSPGQREGSVRGGGQAAGPAACSGGCCGGERVHGGWWAELPLPQGLPKDVTDFEGAAGLGGAEHIQ